MTYPLPERIVIPLGRLVAAQWLPAEDGVRYTASVAGVHRHLDEASYRLWSLAAQGLSHAELVATDEVEGAGARYADLARDGLVAEIPTAGPELMGEATRLRLLAHSRLGLDPVLGLVVGDPAQNHYRPTGATLEVYGWSGVARNLAAAVAEVSSRASESGVNDLEVIYPDRLLHGVLPELCRLVTEGLASWGLVAAEESE